MTDKIKKNLAKFTAKERNQIRSILEKLVIGDSAGLNLLKLKGSQDIYRVRKGNIRIIFRKADKSQVKIMAIERRTEKTYKSY